MTVVSADPSRLESGCEGRGLPTKNVASYCDYGKIGRHIRWIHRCRRKSGNFGSCGLAETRTEYAGYLRVLFIGSAIFTSSCALMDHYVDAPGIKVERIQTRFAYISSANFWKGRNGYYLRGSVIPRAINKMPLSGHIDVAIVAPNGSSTTCFTMRHRNPPRQVRKPFFIRFEKLPEPGSIVRLRHHRSAIHEGCVA